MFPWSTELTDSPDTAGDSSSRVCPTGSVLGDKEKYSPALQSGTYSGLVARTSAEVTAVEKTDKYIYPSCMAGFSTSGIRHASGVQ